ncbi:MAG: hypothetical protein ABIX19_18145 [Gemmatimonadaceae bacterium]
MSVLTWADAVKLAVPVFAGFTLVWFKAWVERRAERASLEQALARGFAEEPLTAEEVVAYLSRAAAAIDRHEPVVIHVLLPSAMLRHAQRLAELDPGNSHAYTDYLAYAESLASANAWLRDSLFCYNMAMGDERDVAAKAAKVALGKVGDTVRRIESVKAEIAQVILTEGVAKPTPEVVRRLRQAAAISRKNVRAPGVEHSPPLRTNVPRSSE